MVTSYLHHVVLRPDEVDRLVHTVTEEFSTRGLTTPFLFSSLALDVDSSRVRRPIEAILRTCVSLPVPNTERTWHEEARFAALAELASAMVSRLNIACLWGRRRAKPPLLGYVRRVE